jgi:UDP-N-acetylmuramate: L-alanyl-gamma-D-glutamyl-meso-diaminopimelate ligase
MGGIAAIAKQAGHVVTGCDAGVYPPMSTQLEAQGIGLIEGWDPKQLEVKPDLFVIGNVVSRGNPLMEEILDRGLDFISGPQWLYENVLGGMWVLAAAGTHGKTTTASMLAWILEHAGLDPGFLIGGVPINFEVSARATGSAFFVIEADEYDTAFFDKRSKFIHYMPRTAILNNLEFDHADIFPDVGAIEVQFHHLVRTVPGNGLIIANGREQSMKRVLARGAWSKVELLGVDEGWIARPRDEHAFDVFFEGGPRGTVQWELLGEHNRHNALAALAAARHPGVPVTKGIEALAEFRNVKRRLEVRGTVNDITLYDDFAHHPTAIETTIAGLRSKVNGSRILAVLEPRSNTMKMGVMKDALAGSLAGADLVFCYTHGLGWDAAPVLAPLGAKSACFDDLAKLTEAIAAASRPGDHVLVMSNGSFGGIHTKLLEALKR